MDKLITVFTPTFNRAYTLHMCYESLCRQTSKNFLWMIIDDGSTDNTKELVKSWQRKNNGFEIIYIYKQNGGLHTGYNTAIEHIETELSICIDSDDYLPDDAVEKISYYWKKNKRENIAGIIGLDFDQKGNVIGGLLPNKIEIDISELLYAKVTGDKKYVIRTDVYKKVAPMPVYNNEKNFNPHYLALKISKEYKFLVLNECLCIVNYQDDGMSANIFKQYLDSPNSFAEYRRLIMTLPNLPFRYRIRTHIHYVSSSIIAKNKKFIAQSPEKLYTIIAIPFGILLNIFIHIKANK